MDTLIKTASRMASADAGRLQALGYKAAMLAESAGLPLTEAVYRTVVGQSLNPTQVQRVVEFTNHEAFNNKYSALLGGPCTAVEFSAGPADPEVVLMQLQKCGESHEAQTAHGIEYTMAPTKRGSLELHFEDMRTPEGLRLDHMRHLSMLKAAHEELTGSVEAARYTKDQLFEQVHENTKRAFAEGADPRMLLAAWQRVDAPLAGPTADRVFPSITVTKVSSANAPINPAHPVVTSFATFSKEARAFATLQKGLLALESQMHDASKKLSAGGV